MTKQIGDHVELMLPVTMGERWQERFNRLLDSSDLEEEAAEQRLKDAILRTAPRCGSGIEALLSCSIALCLTWGARAQRLGLAKNRRRKTKWAAFMFSRR